MVCVKVGSWGCGTVLLQPEAQLLFLPSGQTIESNWRCGRHNLQRIQCRSENSKGVYCLQYDDEKIISGLRDNSIKVSPSLGPCPGCHWGSACASWCPFMGQCLVSEGGMSEPGKVLTCTLLWKPGHCQGSHPSATKVALKSVFPRRGEVSVCHWPWLWLFHCQDFASMLIHPGTSLAGGGLISSWCLVIFHCSLKNLHQDFLKRKGRTKPTDGTDSPLMASGCPPFFAAVRMFKS